MTRTQVYLYVYELDGSSVLSFATRQKHSTYRDLIIHTNDSTCTHPHSHTCSAVFTLSLIVIRRALTS